MKQEVEDQRRPHYEQVGGRVAIFDRNECSLSRMTLDLCCLGAGFPFFATV